MLTLYLLNLHAGNTGFHFLVYCLINMWQFYSLHYLLYLILMWKTSVKLYQHINFLSSGFSLQNPHAHGLQGHFMFIFTNVEL